MNLAKASHAQLFSGKGKEIFVEKLSQMNKFIGAENLSFRARMGPVSEATSPNTKLQKGAFNVLMMGTEAVIDCTIYDSTTQHTVAALQNCMVEVKGASVISMRPYNYQKKIGGLQMVQVCLYAGKYSIQPAAAKAGDDMYPLMESVPKVWLRNAEHGTGSLSVLEGEKDPSVGVTLSMTPSAERASPGLCICGAGPNDNCRMTGTLHVQPVCVVCHQKLDTRFPFCPKSLVQKFKCTTDMDLAIAFGAVKSTVASLASPKPAEKATTPPIPVLECTEEEPDETDDAPPKKKKWFE